MTEKHKKAFDKCVARIRAHKEKCDYHEPEMESVLWAAEALSRAQSIEGLAKAISDSIIVGYSNSLSLLELDAARAVRDYVLGEG